MIRVQNVYYMLALIYKKLNEKEIKKYDQEEFENLYDLFAELIINLVQKQIKKGLNHDYQSFNDELALVKGKINLAETIKRNSKVRHQVICNYEEYTLNSYLNKIIKTTIQFLLNSKKISDIQRKQRLKKIKTYFNDVEEIKTPKRIEWKAIKFNKNNDSYRFLIKICELILKDLYVGPDEKELFLMNYKEDRLMANLYESFIRAYYERKAKVEKKDLFWQMEIISGKKENIPKMQTDISFLDHNNQINLIIDAKFYCKIYQEFYEKEKFNSNNLYQMYAYLKKSGNEQGEGLILYAKTEGKSIGWNEFIVDKNKLVITDLDLSGNFTLIESKLNDILDWHLKKIPSLEMNKKYNKED